MQSRSRFVAGLCNRDRLSEGEWVDWYKEWLCALVEKRHNAEISTGGRERIDVAHKWRLVKIRYSEGEGDVDDCLYVFAVRSNSYGQLHQVKAYRRLLSRYQPNRPPLTREPQ